MLHPCVGPKRARTGEQSICMLCPRRQTSESICDAVLSECESTCPLNPRTQTVPGANLRQNLFQRYHPERTFAKCSFDGSEIKNRAVSPVSFGNHEIAAIDTALQLAWWDSFYRSFLEQTAYLLSQNLGLLRQC